MFDVANVDVANVTADDAIDGLDGGCNMAVSDVAAGDAIVGGC